MDTFEKVLDWVEGLIAEKGEYSYLEYSTHGRDARGNETLTYHTLPVRDLLKALTEEVYTVERNTRG